MAARVFMSYSHKDEALRDQLEVQLTMLKRQGLIEVWHDRRMLAGDQFDWSISQELDLADVVLLLVSPDFLASDYCFNIEKARALQRHREGSARLISVILRPCDWQNTDLSHYVVTPTDGRAVTVWPNIDEALLNVSSSIRSAIEEVRAVPKLPQNLDEYVESGYSVDPIREFPRSSNLRLKKEFSEADRDKFLLDVFEYMGRYFQGSLSELQERNNRIETRFRKPDGDSFIAIIYQGGEKVAACGIRLGGVIGNGISYSSGDSAPTNSMNENLSVEADDQKLYLSSMMGMQYFGGPNSNEKFSSEGAAEYYWSKLIYPLQGN